MITILTISSLYQVQKISGIVLCGLIGGRDYGPCPFPTSPNAPPSQFGQQSPQQQFPANPQFSNPNAGSEPAAASACLLLALSVVSLFPTLSKLFLVLQILVADSFTVHKVLLLKLIPISLG